MTEYRLAQTDDEYREGAELAGTKGFMFPTLLAYRGEEVVGVLATQDRQDAVVAGPLVISEAIPNKGILAARMVDVYDRLMHRLGISQYLFHVAADNEPMLKVMARLPYERVEEAEDGYWYRSAL